MKRGFRIEIAVIALVLIVVGLSYIYQILTKPIEIDFSILFMLLILSLYIVLKEVKLE